MISEGDSVMIMTGKLESFIGDVLLIYNYHQKKQAALVATLDENNKSTTRKYNTENLIKW